MIGFSAALPGGFPSSLRMRRQSLRDLLTGSGLNHLIPTLMLCLGTGLPLSGRNVEFPAEYVFSPGWRERLVGGRGSWTHGKAAVRAKGLLQKETPDRV